MNAWLTARVVEPAVLVTVAIVEGSGPREPGAKMLVTARGQHDTIGGGHLELCAVELAREMLQGAASKDVAAGDAAAACIATARLERYALGPTLGQCCGGVVHLAFELVGAELAAVLAGLRTRQREDSWRLSAIDGPATALLLGADGPAAPLLLGADGVVAAPGKAGEGVSYGQRGPRSDVAGGSGSERVMGVASASVPTVDRERGTHVLRDADGRRWLVDPCLAPRAHLVLFGAGHVGAAIVRLLGELPCTVTWVDEREDMFPVDLPANVTVEATDMPEACVGAAPKDASYLVMTHSHALDQRLTEAILAREDVGWFGLIGSHTKRVQFERRMAARGLPQDRIDNMVCPIGLPGISSKLPAAIAASVCAQLLMVWEQQQIAALNAPARLAVAS
ncbi:MULTISPECIES: xanthine dehydrogenase accessory protein XdhC [unclassified Duganella]|uniref:xanthine dehydrogenase accessory protein XdhC n=1 Tax=unclassified Duganella TaxID=2636909 RepID=UPI000880FE44|nr:MULTISPECIES: xanthine dehydrogenase accessory protein XdhC [unclassified Duganella]SDG65763.1 xanthine dehydrogenase accessory factor [Duganella sp. OV458]SDJ90950.1 xanthine dehydrogenase accessory factor [Duganella sp. OV510]